MDPNYGQQGYPVQQGFYNVQPRTREQRAMDYDHTSLEKQRIAARAHGYRGQEGPPPNNVIMPVPTSAMYLDEHARFANRDAAAAEHERRQALLQRKEAIYEQKRAEGYHRAEKYWNNNIQSHDRVEERLAHTREAGEGGVKKGKSSACYNILTLDYHPTPQGQALEYKDQTVVYKAALRAQNLYNKGNSVTHNIITGAERWQPPVPHAPVAPWDK